MLALDTATAACSVALRVEDSISTIHRIIPRSHSRELLPMIEELLLREHVSLSDLTVIAFGCGPGSFTGLRITVGVVQGLGFGLDVPVIPVSTLACLAQGHYRRHGHEQVLVAMQARQQEIYWGSYRAEDELVVPVLADRVIDASKVPLPGPGTWSGIGDGWQHQDIIEQCLDQKVVEIDRSELPNAQDIIALAYPDLTNGNTLTAQEARPVYLRDRVAATLDEK